MPATSLCLVERVGLLAPTDCCPSSAAPDSSEGNSKESTCCVLVSAQYKLTEQAALLDVDEDASEWQVAEIVPCLQSEERESKCEHSRENLLPFYMPGIDSLQGCRAPPAQ